MKSSSKPCLHSGVTYSGDIQLVEGRDVLWTGKTCCGYQDVKAILLKDGDLVVVDAFHDELCASNTACEDAESRFSVLTSNASGVAAIDCKPQRAYSLVDATKILRFGDVELLRPRLFFGRAHKFHLRNNVCNIKMACALLFMCQAAK